MISKLYSDAKQWQVDESNLMVLHADNMDTALAENDVLLIEFMASWCGNCKRLKPRYAKAADDLIGDGIRLAKVSSSQRLHPQQRPT